MQHHDLKTWPEYYKRVETGQKTFEVRKNDRDFQVGDTVSLYQYDKVAPPSGRPVEDFEERLKFKIGYILHGGNFGIEPGYCVLQLVKID